jgi:methylthioribose-1-phosphate isomerase
VVPQGANILHHCNTGTVATVQYGTAIGIIYTCHAQGKNVHVWVDETRPRLQGAKLTAWELMQANVPMHLIVRSTPSLSHTHTPLQPSNPHLAILIMN